MFGLTKTLAKESALTLRLAQARKGNRGHGQLAAGLTDTDGRALPAVK